MNSVSAELKNVYSSLFLLHVPFRLIIIGFQEIIITRRIRPEMGYGYRWIFLTDRNHSQLFSGFYVLLFLISFYYSQSNFWDVDRLLDFTMALILGNILAHPLSDEKLGMKGEILYKGLGKARITVNHLLSEARKEKIEEIHKIALALWEPDGTISFF